MERVSVLEKYIPLEAARIIEKWIVDSSCQFTITRARRTKFGDYRPPYAGKGHRISVNNNLNPHAFLITAVHEFAHLKTWKEHKNKFKPHGLVWKNNFNELMQPFFALEVFPNDIKEAVSSYLSNPSASSCTDLNLYRALQKYNKVKEGHALLEHLPQDQLFALSSGRIFEKGPKLRKRYRCVEKPSGKVYLFNPLAEVKMLP
jgi:SprT protein